MLTIFVTSDSIFHGVDGGEMNHLENRHAQHMSYGVAIGSEEGLQCAICGVHCGLAANHLALIARVRALKEEETKQELRVIPYSVEAIADFMKDQQQPEPKRSLINLLSMGHFD